MLPTPSTTHIDFNCVYEPAEDSFLLLDTLSCLTETEFLKSRFSASALEMSTTPLILEVGSGSGVVIAFLASQSEALLGREDVLVFGIDVNRYACEATRKTIHQALDVGKRPQAVSEVFIGNLSASLRSGEVDILLFNPPYVPSENLPELSESLGRLPQERTVSRSSFETDSYLLLLSCAGGKDGREVIDRLLVELPLLLSERGVAYVLLCARNRPAEIMSEIKHQGAFEVDVVGSSGKTAGWEKLVVIRIARSFSR